MNDDWADAMNEFRNVVYAALEAGCTPDELKDDIDSAIEEM